MASTSDKITDVRNAARPNSARVTSGRSAGGATLACDNLSGWPTASKVHFVTYKIDSNSAVVAGTQLDCYGIVSGNNIGSFTVVDGTDTGHAVGDIVEMLPTAAWGQDLADALTVGHTRTGAHAANLPLTTPILTTPTIADFTSANHTHATAATGGQLTGAAIAAGSQLADRLLNPYKFSVYCSTAESIGTANTKITYDTKVFDTGTNFSTVTNTFTAPIAGFYQFNVGVLTQVGAAGQTRFILTLFVNGVATKRLGDIASGVAIYGISGSALVQLAANDTITVDGLSVGAACNLDNGGVNNRLEGFLVSAT